MSDYAIRIKKASARIKLHDELWEKYIGSLPYRIRWRRDGGYPPIKVVEIRAFPEGVSRLAWIYAQDGQRFATRQRRRWITVDAFDRLYHRAPDA